MRFFRRSLAAGAAAYAFLAAKAVMAQNLGQDLLTQTGQQAGLQSGTAAQSLPVIVGNLIRTFISLLGLIFLVLIVYGGWLWLTARGESERVEKAKDTITRALIGLVIVVSAYALTSFIVSRIVASATPS